ncbi:hypothetical protein BDZ97DRAFT_1751594 [Flammula alnicola]|nr:hypothetical protein BDZ97DRAFT_1751594 [Flammula alnicola]
MQMKTRRKELLEKAIKIKSLDNSPVNERQLLVLRMVYDEITMYPCESWMVLIAIVINRAYKQVKNWFSNERQKNRVGESIPVETEDGDKVRRNSRFRGSLRQQNVLLLITISDTSWVLILDNWYLGHGLYIYDWTHVIRSLPT